MESSMATQKMGLLYGLEKNQFCKRQNRWLFEVPGVSADETVGVQALPPLKSSRPSISFKEMEARHLNEDVFYPAKPDWKPITITLWDLNKASHPVWDWIALIYQPHIGRWFPAVDRQAIQPSSQFIRDCYLKMFDGCGETVETWKFEDAWCNNINFQTLDMGSSDILTCEFTLRYARAYIQ